jgi:hypothetical protein
MTRWRAFVVLVSALTLPGCGANIDLKQSAHLVDVTTGWYDAGVQPDGKNKLVPSVSFRIKNDGAVTIGSTQFNMIFKRVTDTEEWTTSFVKPIGSDGLAPGATTKLLVVRAQQGYTGTQPRLTMLQNSQFVDFKVEIFGKHGSATWVKLGDFPIRRQLLTD